MGRRPEHPVTKLARLVGGSVMMRGPLPYRVLGTLVLTRTTDVEWLGAQLAIAATASTGNAFAQTAVATAAPTLAVRAVAQRQRRRLARLERNVVARLEELQALRDAGAPAALKEALAKVDALEQENRTLRTRLGMQPEEDP